MTVETYVMLAASALIGAIWARRHGVRLALALAALWVLAGLGWLIARALMQADAPLLASAEAYLRDTGLGMAAFGLGGLAARRGWTGEKR